jgi:hypothetical protein
MPTWFLATIAGLKLPTQVRYSLAASFLRLYCIPREILLPISLKSLVVCYKSVASGHSSYPSLHSFMVECGFIPQNKNFKKSQTHGPIVNWLLATHLQLQPGLICTSLLLFPISVYRHWCFHRPWLSICCWRPCFGWHDGILVVFSIHAVISILVFAGDQ